MRYSDIGILFGVVVIENPEWPIIEPFSVLTYIFGCFYTMSTIIISRVLSTTFSEVLCNILEPSLRNYGRSVSGHRMLKQ